MAKQKKTTAVETTDEQPSPTGSPTVRPTGLVIRGTVQRRRRREVGEEHVEVVTYTVGPRFAEFEVWRPEQYWGVGEEVEVEVIARVWQGVTTYQVPRQGEEF